MSERLSRLRAARMSELATQTETALPLLRRALRTPAAFREAYAHLITNRAIQAAHTLIRERKTPVPGATLEKRLVLAVYRAIDTDRKAIEAAEQRDAWAMELARSSAKEAPK